MFIVFVVVDSDYKILWWYFCFFIVAVVVVVVVVEYHTSAWYSTQYLVCIIRLSSIV